jgi:hypothetical protein
MIKPPTPTTTPMMVFLVLELMPPEPLVPSPVKEAVLEGEAEEVVLVVVDEEEEWSSLLVVGGAELELVVVGGGLVVVCELDDVVVLDWLDVVEVVVELVVVGVLEGVVELLLVVVVVVVVDEEEEEEEEEEELLLVDVGLPVSDGDEELPVPLGDGVLLAVFPEDVGSPVRAPPTGPRLLPSWRPTRKAGKRFACVTATAARTATRWDCGRNNMMVVVDECDGSWITGRTVGMLTRFLVSTLQQQRETDVTGCEEKKQKDGKKCG